MDPITIISLIGNVIQFVQFSNDLVSKSVQLYQSSNGALAELNDTMTATNHLLGLNYKLKDAAAKTSDKTLRDLCISCESTADELLMALDRVRVKHKHRKWESIRKALLTVWSRDEIAELERRLAKLREELNMHITADLRSGPKFPEN
jgi:BMFP domain-containing protein YqiC